MDVLSVQEAAERLGIAPQRVRALIRAGRLPARRLGRAWAIQPADPGWDSRPRKPGRPLRAANAWALLAILDGGSPGWIDPAVRSRLRKRARDPQWVESALIYGEQRSSIHRWRLLPPDLERIKKSFPLVLSGLSADDPGIDVVPVSAELDAYLDRSALSGIRRQFHPLESSEAPNLILRIPSIDWILHLRHAPSSVVAADLLDHLDPRVHRAAHRLLKQLGP